MKFICPKCGTRDEVIGDDAPRCLVCCATLLKAVAGYRDLLMSPNVAIKRFETVIQTIGFEAATKGSAKREREAWIAAVWALGIQKITGNEYWIEIETRDRTPDCKVHFIDQSAGHNHVKTHNLEITEWDEHRPDVMDVIAQKSRRAYPAYFSLVVLARNGKRIEVEAVSHQIKAEVGPFGEIWVLGRLSETATEYEMLMLHPNLKSVQFDLVEAVTNNSNQIDFLQRQKRGKSTELIDLGLIYLPIA